MGRVLKELDKAAKDLAPDPVHDLRVALRRCRSVAEGFRSIDPDPSWKKMRKAGKELFSSLGDLRDAQVMMTWTTKIGGKEDSVTQALLDYFTQQESTLKQQVEDSLAEFDRKQWTRWASSLPRRAARVPLGSEAFQCIALERWTQARRLQPAALKSDNPAAWHRLRIALKKFRYVVENFLPDHHRDWVEALKRIQDLLGDLHDLDLLWDAAVRLRMLTDPDARRRWEERIQSEHRARIEEYKQAMCGQDSLWSQWRTGLPRGDEASNAVFRKFEVWASFLDPDSGHSRRIMRFALQLHDGLVRMSMLREDSARSRDVLRAAAILHDVGYADGNKNHHKATRRLVRKLDVPFAWRRLDLEVAAMVAGYHRGALPRPNGKGLAILPPDTRQTAKQLSGILRLANALDRDHNGTVSSIKIEKAGDHIVIYAAGLNPLSKLAENVAAARYLLEMSCRIPIMIKPMPRASRRRPTR